MKTNTVKQYTIRNIPANIDRALRQRMKDEGKSLNAVVLEVLATGSKQSLGPRRDLSYLFGSMTEQEAQRLDEEIEAQKTIDPKLWR
ncbi:MAG TPA: hypothetical protein VEL47_01235 [Myxococcota bacterium]|nr:hypothetical protein [Myxococcota bacterium]